jgi:hypothetical protein
MSEMTTNSAPSAVSASSSPSNAPAAPSSAEAAAPSATSAPEPSASPSTENAPASGEQPIEKPAWIIPDGGVLKIKGAGKEHEIKSFEELQRLAQLGIGGHNALREAAELKKQRDTWAQEREATIADVRALFDDMRSDPEAVLSKVGVDVNQWIEKRIEKMLADANTPPEVRAARAEAERLQRERDELANWRHTRETEDQRMAREADEAEQNQAREAAKQEIVAEIDGALAQTPDFADPELRPLFMDRVALARAQARAEGIDITTEQAIGFVRAETMKLMQNMTRPMSAEALAQWLGADKLRELREWDLARVRGAAKPSTPASAPATPKGKMTLAEFMAAKRAAS